MGSRRDMLFCVLFIGDERLIRHMVLDSARRLGVLEHWDPAIRSASLLRLRSMFFLLMDRDSDLKQKLMAGWSELCIAGVDSGKAGVFFQSLRTEVIEPWIIDERKSEDELVSNIIDLYLLA